MISTGEIIYLNEIGRREQLEDSIFPAPQTAGPMDKLFLVCDGVGGESKGEEASRVACSAFADYFKQSPPNNNCPTKNYIDEAQRYVLGEMGAYANNHPDADRMSTTLTLAYLGDEGVFTAWCGDSRIYHIRNGQVLWRSKDHSLVANLVKHGEISEEEARKHPKRNVILRSLSASGDHSEIETFCLKDIQEGDYILLCTDGVLEQIDESRLHKILTTTNTDKRALFLNYCFGNTKDNFSLYLLELKGSSPILKRNEKSSLYKKLAGFFMVAFLLALAIFFTIKLLSPADKPASADVKHNDKGKLKSKIPTKPIGDSGVRTNDGNK